MTRKRSSAARTMPGEAAGESIFAQRRSTPRILARKPAWLTFNSRHKNEHIALVKDISIKGILFYSDLRPALGEQLDFVLEYLTASEQVRLHLKGAVVRLESAISGCGAGVAVSFHLQGDRYPKRTPEGTV